METIHILATGSSSFTRCGRNHAQNMHVSAITFDFDKIADYATRPSCTICSDCQYTYARAQEMVFYLQGEALRADANYSAALTEEYGTDACNIRYMPSKQSSHCRLLGSYKRMWDEKVAQATRYMRSLA